MRIKRICGHWDDFPRLTQKPQYRHAIKDAEADRCWDCREKTAKPVNMEKLSRLGYDLMTAPLNRFPGDGLDG